MKVSSFDRVSLWYWRDADRLLLSATLTTPFDRNFSRLHDILVTGEREILFTSIDDLKNRGEHLDLVEPKAMSPEDLADFLGG